MFKDFNDLNNQKNLSCDICIVGSGPAGISVAKKFLDTNFKVILLESGGIEPSVNYNELNKGENSGPRFLSLDGARTRCFGGASRIWAGHCAPFAKEDFQKHPFVPLSGWPIQRGDLDIYYQEAAEMLGISYDKFNHDSSINMSFAGESFPSLKGKDSLLSTYVLQISNSTNRNFGAKYQKNFLDAKNIEVILHSTVTKINISENGKRVDNLEAQDISMKKCVINAKKFVLAAGALENSRLLLAETKVFNKGIGNSKGFVGSCFMSHPGFTGVAKIFKTSKARCLPKNEYITEPMHKFSASSHEKINNQILSHGFDLKPVQDLANLSTYSSGQFNRNFRKLFNDFNFKEASKKVFCKFNGNNFSSNLWNLNIGIEQEPSRRNFLTLSSLSKDIFGVPLINMFWADISKREKITVEKSVKLLARQLGKNNSGRVQFTENLLSEEVFNQPDPVNHHIGTTRMAKTIDNGVVDMNCKVFDLSNLYISGSSVFPTSSVVNPTFTIIALSLRLGDYLKKRLS
jgi:choline dehydrogenase-like flavoprotein